jgi:hypothetical protein
MEVCLTIVRSPTFFIGVGAVFVFLRVNGFFRFRRKKKFSLERRGVPWDE